jgi:NAD(P)-dependent dehydrogenase (short-subunit alcohol dehydrogenase family)
MSAVDAVAASNAQLLSSLQSPPHVVIVGGTSGIGRGIALTIHRHCPAAYVTIIGRNESAANEILSQLGSNGNFIRADVSLMSEIRAVTKQIKAVDILVLSQGVLTMNIRARTNENINNVLALLYYGRVLFVQELLPLLRSSPLGGKVLSVLNSQAGNLSKVNWNDMGLESIRSLLGGFHHALTFNDLIIQYLASQPENANVSFIHAYPGFVKTPLGDNLPFYIRLPLRAMVAIRRRVVVSPEECAEFMIHGVMGTEKGYRYIDEKGETITNKTVANDEMLQKLWEHTRENISRTAS